MVITKDNETTIVVTKYMCNKLEYMYKKHINNNLNLNTLSR